MKLPSNRERADWASVALDAFAETTRMTYEGSGEDRETRLTDLLCDLMHFCDVEGIKWNTVMQNAAVHYITEVAEENEVED